MTIRLVSTGNKRVAVNRQLAFTVPVSQTFPEAGGWHDTLSSSAIYEVERRGASVEDATPDAIFGSTSFGFCL